MSAGGTSAHRAQSEIRIKNLFSALCSEEEAERIAKEVAECFGSIDALFATPEEVRQKVFENLDIAGKKGGMDLF